MVDLSKHLQRAKQAIERRQYDFALGICIECQEIDPANIENYKLLTEAAKKKAKEGGKKSLFGGLSFGGFSKDPQKALSGAVKKLAKGPDVKAFLAAGDAAKAVADTGLKVMNDVAVLFYEEGRSTGLFNNDLLWNLAHAYQAQFAATKEVEPLEKGIKALVELDANSKHPDAARLARQWEAMKSMAKRSGAGSGDYRSQLASDEGARRNEVMARVIRSAEDAKEVLAFLEDDLKTNGKDKATWQKKGDVHRRVGQYDESIAAFHKAQEIDPHDFVITIRLGDTKMEKLKATIAREEQQTGQKATQLRLQLLDTEIAEYTMRVERQPTEMSHSFNLGTRLFQSGEVDQAAAYFQKAVADPRFKRKCHFYLGHCFAKKKLLDLAAQQYTSCLSLIEDELSDEAKEVRYNRARILEQQGKIEEAAADYTKLVEIDLGFKDAATRLANLRGG
jgi:tetratricopeptide (TPR) repeat protein